MVAPRAKRAEALYLAKSYNVSKARSARHMGMSISTLDYKARAKDDESVRTELVDLADKNKRFGHPRLFVLLRARISGINHKRSRTIYSELGLQIGRRKRKKRGSQTRLPATRATAPMQAWAIDFMIDILESGRRLKVFTVVDEFSRISPRILVSDSIRGEDVADFLDQLATGDYPKVIRVDQGTEFTSRAMLNWAYTKNITLEFTKVRKPTNQVIEAFNSRVRDECMNEHVFFSIQDAREKIDQWHWRYNHHNPHSALAMKAPMALAKDQETMLAG